MKKYSEQLFDKTEFIINRFSDSINEVTRLQTLMSLNAKSSTKYSKSLHLGDNFKKQVQNTELFDSYFNSVLIHSKSVKKSMDVFARNCNIQTDSLDRLKKFVDSNRKELRNKQIQNEKLYVQRKRLLKAFRKKQQKYAKEAHEWFIKHERLVNDVNVEKPELDMAELRFIHAAKEEDKFSRQYKNIWSRLHDYQNRYVKTNQEILQDCEDHDKLIVQNMKAHLLRFAEDQEEMLVSVLKSVSSFKKEIAKLDTDEKIQDFISSYENTSFQLEPPHEYAPFTPIYKMEESEREDYLSKSRNVELSIEQSKLRDFFGNLGFGKKGNRKSLFVKGKVQKRIPSQNFPPSNPEEEMTEKPLTPTTPTKLTPPDPSERSASPKEQINGRKKRRETQIVYQSVVAQSSTFEDVSRMTSSREGDERGKQTNKEDEKSPETLFFENFYDKLVSEEQNVEEEEIEKGKKMLESKEGRLGLAEALNYKRDNPFLEDRKSFEILGELISKCLEKSHSNQDQDVGKMLLNMCQTFYTIDEEENQVFYFKYLSHLEIWKNIRFWEACFYDLMSQMRKKSNHYTHKWRDLDESGRKEATREHANMCYGILTSFVFSMMETGIAEKEVRKFVEKMCEINQLEKYQENMIMEGYNAMLKNRNK